jgi:hypothetical protein
MIQELFKFQEQEIDLETVLRIHEQLGTEPEDSEIPPSMDEFPIEVQNSFTIYSHLGDKWEGMSGSYLGKDLNSFSEFCNIEGFEDKKIILQFVKQIDNVRMGILTKKAEQKAKDREKQSNPNKVTYSG